MEWRRRGGARSIHNGFEGLDAASQLARLMELRCGHHGGDDRSVSWHAVIQAQGVHGHDFQQTPHLLNGGEPTEPVGKLDAALTLPAEPAEAARFSRGFSVLRVVHPAI